VYLYIFADMILKANSLRRQDLTSPKNIPNVAESKKHDLNNAEAVVYQVIYLTGRKKTKTLHIKAESDGRVPRGQRSICMEKDCDVSTACVHDFCIAYSEQGKARRGASVTCLVYRRSL
jgi:hypothetical protein